jgi:hypothetical protein
MGCGGIDWNKLDQERESWQTVLNAVINFRVPENVGIFTTGCKPVSFSRRTVLHGVSKEGVRDFSIIYFVLRPATWVGGQNLLLLTMRSRVRLPVLPWEFFLVGEDPHSDHGLGSL